MKDKIAFITWIKDENNYKQCLKYINNLNIPEGISTETIKINDSKSIFENYNKAMKLTDAKYKVYLKENVFIINKNFIYDILEIFKDKTIGMIGIVGGDNLSNSLIWWEAEKCYGKVYADINGNIEILNLEDKNDEVYDIDVIDGAIMITQNDIKWREDILKREDFYNVSQSFEFRRAGYRVVIPKQAEPWCKYYCGNNYLSKNNKENRNRIILEYGKQFGIEENNFGIKEQNNVKFTGERLIINEEVKNSYSDVLMEHLQRYKFACNYVKDKVVLDAACGAGYGSNIMGKAGAKSVTGIDISQETVNNAKLTYSEKNINFELGDVTKLKYNDKSFDVVVSFETIEHIPSGRVWIDEAYRVLKDEGLYIVSTPNRYITNPGTFIEESPMNCYHVYEYNIPEFVGELLRKYEILGMYGQTVIPDHDTITSKVIRKVYGKDENYKSNVSFNNEKFDLIDLSEIKNAQPMYVVAVCKKKGGSQSVNNISSKTDCKCNNNSQVRNESNIMDGSVKFYKLGETSYLGEGYNITNPQGISIGNNVVIKDGCWLNICVPNEENELKIIIKDCCSIGSRFAISVSNKCIIERNVIIGPNVYIADCEHRYQDIGIPIMSQGITSTTNEVIIGENSWIGINAVIVGNVHVGKGCVIGANSYVTKDVPDYCVVVGTPAKIVKAFDINTGKWVKVKDEEAFRKNLEEREKLTKYMLQINALNSIQVEVSSICNLKCPQCFNNIEGHKSQILKVDLWQEKIRPILKYLKSIHLVGIGEPLLCKELFDYIEECKQYGMEINTTSNLQLVNDEIAKKIVLSGITNLSFSCDGVNEETYNSIRINGTYKKLVESIELINKYKKLYKTDFPKLILNFGAIERNIKELPQLVKNAHEWKVAGIIAYHDIIYVKSFEKESLFYNKALSDEIFLESKKLADSLGIDMFYPGTFKNSIKREVQEGTKYCLYPYAHLWIYSDGRVGPCCMDFPNRIVLGNLNNSTIEEVWNSKEILKLRESMDTVQCDTCKYCAMHGKMDINDKNYLIKV